MRRPVFCPEIKSYKRRKRCLEVDNSWSGVNWLHWELLRFQDGEVLAVTDTLRWNKIKINLSHLLVHKLPLYIIQGQQSSCSTAKGKQYSIISTQKTWKKICTYKWNMLFVLKVHIHCPVRHFMFWHANRKKYQAQRMDGWMDEESKRGLKAQHCLRVKSRLNQTGWVAEYCIKACQKKSMYRFGS